MRHGQRTLLFKAHNRELNRSYSTVIEAWAVDLMHQNVKSPFLSRPPTGSVSTFF